MSSSFSINAYRQRNRLKKPLSSFSDAAAAASSDSSTRRYVTEFSLETSPAPESSHPREKLKNLSSLPQISQSNYSERGANPELASDNSPMCYGLNLRPPSSAASEDPTPDDETISDMELRKLREDLKKLPDPVMDEYMDVPVEGFGATLLYGHGWREGQGIGRNAKEDVKAYEVTRKVGRGGLGFTGENKRKNSNEGKWGG